jgi:hypothetical protein
MLGRLTAVRVDGRYEALRLLVRRRVDAPQEVLERKGLRPDDYRLIAAFKRSCNSSFISPLLKQV